MTVSIIDDYAEQKLFAYIVEQEASQDEKIIKSLSFLHCRFFQVNLKLRLGEIADCLGDIFKHDDATVYVCEDGDLIIQFMRTPSQLNIISDISSVILERYQKDISKYMPVEDFFESYDMVNTHKKLRLLCIKKQGLETKSSRELIKHFNNEILINTISNITRLISMQRSFRSKPHILIVEDQAFSQKLLLNTLKGYTCHVAETVGEAFLQYMEHCPDIVLLDLELPGPRGHEFSKLLSKIDPDSYVVMISANCNQDDVKKAQENMVKNYIVKPYTKKNISDALRAYSKSKKRRL
ncbi:MAG: response regulator [Bdellovibrionales bacterium]